MYFVSETYLWEGWQWAKARSNHGGGGGINGNPEGGLDKITVVIVSKFKGNSYSICSFSSLKGAIFFPFRILVPLNDRPFIPSTFNKEQWNPVLRSRGYYSHEFFCPGETLIHVHFLIRIWTAEKDDHRSSMQKLKLEKIQTWTRFEPMTSVIQFSALELSYQANWEWTFYTLIQIHFFEIM